MTWRSAKTWRRTSKSEGKFTEAPFCEECFPTNQIVSTTSGSKVMAHYVIFTKVVTLTLIFIRFSPKNFARVLGTEYISCQNFRKIEPVVWPVHRAITDRQTDRQTDERALGECILCKIGLTDWVIYLLDWMWPRWRAQSIGPNDSNEKCAMSRVLFRINIAAIAENTCPWPFTFDHDFFFTFYLDIWPWDWSIITLMLQRKNWCFEENKPRNFQSLGQI